MRKCRYYVHFETFQKTNCKIFEQIRKLTEMIVKLQRRVWWEME
ncbi:hypothetical protein HMPREF3191_01605 [Veillonellaceae bacterium DNF00626]|nr:hypothetical protein HMPREF3191_01605 [Veillonellaceae bacterium DNF00626]